ncbi:complement factor I-like [Carassius carassius]|uniref:complement factor I-like n=1 Tax=Carassius carassius TaxID=217509 RepID=UPI0028697F0C|nr:complement factor I-like [Carassius carassius]
MKVLSVLFFMYLLLQTTSLGGQEKSGSQTNPMEKTDTDLKQEQELRNQSGETQPDMDHQSEQKTEENGPLNSEPIANQTESHVVPLASTESETLPEPTESRRDLESKSDSNPKVSKERDEDFLGTAQCLKQKYTWLSCSKVFCPPWRRCIEGQCVCKMPYKCPRQQNTCTQEGPVYYSMCQANAISCRTKTPTFSHFSPSCKATDKVTVSVSDSQNVVVINTGLGKMLVCGKGWNMAAANVVCRNPLKVERGAEKADSIQYKSVNKDTQWENQCMRVRCMGYELSLAECRIHNPEEITEDTMVAVAKCYEEPQGECKKFICANGKCLSSGKPCNGVDDCGDNSDEMCCQKCRVQGFLCKSGVCIPRSAIKDGIRDCLGGDDEYTEIEVKPKKKEELFSDPMSEIKTIRSTAEDQLQCGIPNKEYVYKQEDDATSHSRKKRLVGGEEALPTQIQWQVAIQDEGSIHCGGAYLGGCWVLTAAHCVRPKPRSFRIKFSLWMKHRKQSTTDSIPVKNIIIHHKYNPQTYENDIALVQLEELNLSDKCMQDNPAVRAVCVPWSTQQFQPNDTCTISGWGRDREGISAAILKWANVTIISDCQSYYKDRFFPGMECAGDLEGKVDSCQGDSGGPLVCTDASGLSYVWGIVSWGDKCGEPNHPGVYTKVAHYFDWIRFHTGWPAVTKFNQ